LYTRLMNFISKDVFHRSWLCNN